MTRNVGTADAWTRGTLAVVLIFVAVLFNQQPAISLAAALGALICAGTALTRSCPLYSVLGITTRRRQMRGNSG